MLVLSRKVGERIRIGGDIEVIVRAIQGDRIKIGIEAPREIDVRRGELARDDRTGAAILEVGPG